MNKLLNFEKVEVKKNYRGGKTINISPNKRALSLSKGLMEEMQIKSGTRFDLYKNGKTFALVKESAGLIKFSISNENQAVCSSVFACLEIMAESNGNRKFNAWIDEDIIFFRVDE